MRSSQFLIRFMKTGKLQIIMEIFHHNLVQISNITLLEDQQSAEDGHSTICVENDDLMMIY